MTKLGKPVDTDVTKLGKLVDTDVTKLGKLVDPELGSLVDPHGIEGCEADVAGSREVCCRYSATYVGGLRYW